MAMIPTPDEQRLVRQDYRPPLLGKLRNHFPEAPLVVHARLDVRTSGHSPYTHHEIVSEESWLEVELTDTRQYITVRPEQVLFDDE